MPTNPLNPWVDYSDPNNALNLDAFNRLALGPLYVPRDPTTPLSAGAGQTETTPPAASSTWYHGTNAAFESFNTPEVYLTDHPGQAAQYALNAHLGGNRGDKPVVLSVKANPGKVANIDDQLSEAMEEGDDVGDALDDAIANHRNGGQTRYVEYTHPNAGVEGDHTVRVSLYPREDLTINR